MMWKLKNTVESYGLVARVLHWAIGLMVIGMLIIGTIMTDMENGPDKMNMYGLHKSFGMTILGLMLMRIIWRLINVVPQAPTTHKLNEVRLAKLVHYGFYLLLVGLPLSGWVMSSAYGYAPSWFGLFTFKNIVNENKELGEFSKEIHEILATGLWVALGLHVLGALKHHFINKDNTLLRMINK